MNELTKIELEVINGGESGFYYLGRFARMVVESYRVSGVASPMLI